MKLKNFPLSFGAKLRASIGYLAAALTCLTLPGVAQAQTWVGANANGWGDAANWTTVIPGTNNGTFTSTDSALFNTNPSNRIVTIDTNRNIQSLNFDTGAGIFTIGSAAANAGNSLFLTSGGKIEILPTLTGTQSQTVNAPLVIAGADATYSFLNNKAATSVLTIAGSVSGGTAGNTVLTLGGASAAANIVSGIISNGSATSLSLVKDGASAAALWTLQGNNTYTGTTTVNGGILRLRNNNALGSTSGNTSISGSTSSIQLQNGITVAETLNIAGTPNTQGALVNSVGANTWSGTINVNTSTGNGAAFAQNAGNTAGAEKFTASGPVNLTGSGAALGLQGTSGVNVGEISGKISGGGNVTKASASTWILSGSNDYTGSTTLSAGTLALGDNSALGNGGQFLMTGSSTIQSSDGTTRTISNPFGTFAGTSAVYSFGAQSGGQISGGTGNLVFTNTTTASLGSSAARTVAVTNSTEFNAGLSGTGSSINKTLSGTLILKGASTYTGGTTVTAGTLLVSNSPGSGLGTGNATVNGGTLGGTGSFTGAVTVNSSGTLAPGASIESLASGAVTFNTGSTFAYEVDSTSVGADLQVVSGALTLNGTVTLTLANLSVGTFVNTTKFTLLNYNGAWNNGLFTYNAATLADDSTFAFNGQSWQIDYNATSGGSNFSGEYLSSSNYVNITVVPEPATWALVAFSLTAVVILRRRKQNP